MVVKDQGAPQLCVAVGRGFPGGRSCDQDQELAAMAVGARTIVSVIDNNLVLSSPHPVYSGSSSNKRNEVWN